MSLDMGIRWSVFMRLRSLNKPACLFVRIDIVWNRGGETMLGQGYAAWGVSNSTVSDSLVYI